MDRDLTCGGRADRPFLSDPDRRKGRRRPDEVVTAPLDPPGGGARAQAIGIQIAVDDFGTGYSSMLHLRQFPVDVLKMDRTFVAGITRDEQDRTIVEATIGLARALGHQTVAEGVEEAEQLEMLRSLGCDLAQGYLWSRPVEPQTIERLLREGLPTPGA